MWFLIILQLQNNTGWRTEIERRYEFDSRAECFAALENAKLERPRNSDTSLSAFCVPADYKD